MTGLYVTGGAGDIATGATEITLPARGGTFAGFEADGGLYRETQATLPGGMPQYKPEFWDRVIDAEYNGNFEDPAQNCMPAGVPRLGPPGQIIALKDQPFVVLIYSMREVRIVPTDGREHNSIAVVSETWNGDPVGHWEGDTLVVESVGFTDESWLSKTGAIHGFKMKVTEKLTRLGNSLTWQATVDDPEYFTMPWVMAPVTLNVNTNPNAALVEPLPCREIDRLHVVLHTRSG
jgi:hypothetical protein